MTLYYEAEPVEAIAAGLIPQHHPHLHTVPIRYLFVDPPPVKGGKAKAGTARKVTTLAAYLAGPVADLEGSSHRGSFFVVEVALAWWNGDDKLGFEAATPEARAALVDHELCHLAWDAERDSPILRPHDLEEFVAVVERHGLWRTDVFDLVAAGAPQLDFESPPP